MRLPKIQAYLQENNLDGWLLYSFQSSNPLALSMAGLPSGGSRRWFLWLPAQGQPQWLIHAIESNNFANVAPEMQGLKHRYTSWKDLYAKLGQIVHTSSGRAPRILAEYSPDNAIPYISRMDAGMKEMIEESTGAEILSSADLAQLTLAVLSPEQMAGHREVANHCLAIKEAAFDLVAQRLRDQQPVNEYEVQQFIMERFAAVGLETDHPPIVAVNRFAADPHYAPSASSHNPIQVGDTLLIDLWSRFGRHPEDCFADETWTAFCGSVTPPKVKQIFDIVAQARDAAVSFIQSRLDARQPVYGYEVDDACRAVIEQAGYGDAFFHRTGHSLGWMGHFIGVNLDNLETQDRRQLIPGVMFTIEPGIYLPDFNFDDSPTPKGLGIRSEINCFMHEDHVEVTTLPIQTEVRALLA
ncbi:MAG: M24 family metallopeptidase [Chloroflexi bacterium]|nr:M24 family metallopeptidase [Chloroflexota bacterium]